MESEHQIQVSLKLWFNLRYGKQYPNLFVAIPNGGARHIVTAKKLKAEGVSKGFPDIFIPIPMDDGHGLFIELKTKKGRATEEQIAWCEYLNSVNYSAHICKGFDEAKTTIENYLK